MVMKFFSFTIRYYTGISVQAEMLGGDGQIHGYTVGLFILFYLKMLQQNVATYINITAVCSVKLN